GVGLPEFGRRTHAPACKVQELGGPVDPADAARRAHPGDFLGQRSGPAAYVEPGKLSWRIEPDQELPGGMFAPPAHIGLITVAGRPEIRLALGHGSPRGLAASILLRAARGGKSRPRLGIWTWIGCRWGRSCHGNWRA